VKWWPGAESTQTRERWPPSGRLSNTSRTELVPRFQNYSSTLISPFGSRMAVDISYNLRKFYYKHRCSINQ